MALSVDRTTSNTPQRLEGRLLRWSSFRSEGALLAVVIAAILAILIVPPLVFLVFGSLHHPSADGSAGPLTVRNYLQVLTTRDLTISAANSVAFSAGSALVALLLGGAQAWLTERTNSPFKGLAYFGAIMSLAIPYILYVIAALYTFTTLGPIDALCRWLLHTSLMPSTLQSLGGMIFIEGLLWTPFVFLMLAPVFRSADPALEEAALAAGASGIAIFLRISLRLATPAILAVLLLVFIKGLESFEVPALVGLPANVNVLTTEIYLHLKMSMPPDLGQASAFAVLLILIVALLLRGYRQILRHAERYRTVIGKAFRPRLVDLGWKRWPAGALFWLIFLVYVALPLLSLVWISIMPYYQAVSMRGLPHMTLVNYGKLLEAGGDVQALVNTILLSLAAASIAMALSILAGWLIARNRPGSGWIDQLGSLPLVVPGIVLAVAIMQFFLVVPLPIYGTIWILLVAFVIRYLPYGLRYASAGILQIDLELEEAAGASGAGVAQRFGRIVLPLIKPAVTVGWLFILLLMVRDLSLPVLLSAPTSQVISVQFFDLWQNGQAPELAAFGVVWTAMMSVAAAVFFVLARRVGSSWPVSE